ncbi:hypothetical protein P8452_30234 [Trifolium repens]|nr:hypothetical protein P8452_30234 [Trifolium repens]
MGQNFTNKHVGKGRFKPFDIVLWKILSSKSGFFLRFTFSFETAYVAPSFLTEDGILDIARRVIALCKCIGNFE